MDDVVALRVEPDLALRRVEREPALERLGDALGSSEPALLPAMAHRCQPFHTVYAESVMYG